jgi:hypothetical protein
MAFTLLSVLACSQPEDCSWFYAARHPCPSSEPRHPELRPRTKTNLTRPLPESLARGPVDVDAVVEWLSANEPRAPEGTNDHTTPLRVALRLEGVSGRRVDLSRAGASVASVSIQLVRPSPRGAARPDDPLRDDDLPEWVPLTEMTLTVTKGLVLESTYDAPRRHGTNWPPAKLSDALAGSRDTFQAASLDDDGHWIITTAPTEVSCTSASPSRP